MIFTPYKYQLRAIEFVMDRQESLLALDMGLGKSVITLTAIQRLIDCGEVCSALVVAPKKVAETTWSDEAEKWDHLRHLRVSRVIGDERKRNKALDEKADVYVIGRDSVVWLVKKYGGVLPFDMLILDELTSFKTPKSHRFKAIRISRPSVPRVIGLTGTPAPNGLIDLWAQVYCIDMGERLGKSVTRYRDTYFSIHRWNNIPVRTTIKPGAEDVIRSKIADITLTMQAKDYLELPDMIVHDTFVEFSAKTAAGYKNFERERVLEFADEHKGEDGSVMAGSAAALMNKLAQYAAGAMYDAERMVHEIHSEKIDALSELVESTNGQSVLVFYQFKHDILRIRQALKGYRVRTYDGADDLKAWNAGEVDVLLAHPAATAYGLNMQQGGHYIVWFGTGWNLEHYMQANARLHRQGQRYPVQVFRMICRNTVDEKACSAIDNKKGVQQSLLDSLSELIKEHAHGK